MKRVFGAVVVIAVLAGFLFLLSRALESFAHRPPEPPRIEVDGRFVSGDDFANGSRTLP